MTEVIVVSNEYVAGTLAAEVLHELIRRRPNVVLGLATGSTPRPVYQALAASVKAARLDVSRIRGFALDEYVGLRTGHPESYRAVIDREVIGPLGLNPSLVQVPDGSADRIEHSGARYEEAITTAGGIDAQILGVGTDGHIGFNEPGSSLASRTRVKTLTAQTRADNARFFASLEEVPTHCITQGLGTILKARRLLLLAFGASKAEAIAGAVEGPVTSRLPASTIQLHEHATVIVDEAAASRLENLEYYRYAYANKPRWQVL
ncbi:glucosamine-6-phosphate deaminase [Leifsonia sp. 21MFCrub1.1]|uniref:glucosamine-6-phosphate deaminase n=1 Tax=Leifsonia sp. 21MFCrub1.1 TaxID=1798223 RepID=UPI0008929A5B|nr:glucosamine-6-phosphate deaminase [Leifsonia sp. 21MFCrub1.1]SEB09651.1 glucosamine-6-phosphate deaminase [Leifsonia sp. 21MFCrub1.1]